MTMARENGEDGTAVAETVGGGLSSLFDRNRAWAGSKTLDDPGFFKRLLGQQRPRYFWIGCSDSRVPATEIVDLDPGEMFVHRNVANLAHATDPSFSAALQFAVDVLEVEHIIVVGHYGCGGIQAAMGDESDDPIGAWLAPIRALHRARDHDTALSADRLCEHNVRSQISGLAANPIVGQAWERGKPLNLHGWVYAIGDGLLQPVCAPTSGRPVDEIAACSAKGAA